MPSPVPQSFLHQPVVVNPYLKKEGKENCDSPLSSKRKFVTKYSDSRGVEFATASELRRKRLRPDQANEIDNQFRSVYLFPSDESSHEDGVFQLENDITELSGEGGSGKTQICLSVAVDCAMKCSNDDGYVTNESSSCASQNTTRNSRNQSTNQPHHPKAIFVNTRCNTSLIAKRLEAMVQTRVLFSQKNNRPSNMLELHSTRKIKSILQNIYLISVTNEEALLDFLSFSLPGILKSQNIRVVILDDIATFYRFSDASLYEDHRQSNAMFARDRTGDLWSISRILRKLATVHNLPILVVNQVTAAASLSHSSRSLLSNTEENIPALGLIWSHCVGLRIMLGKYGSIASCDREKKGADKNNAVHLRYARVLQAVNYPIDRTINFVVGDAGVRLVLKTDI